MTNKLTEEELNFVLHEFVKINNELKNVMTKIESLRELILIDTNKEEQNE